MARDDERLEYFVVLHVVEQESGKIVGSIETPCTRSYLLDDGLLLHKRELEVGWTPMHGEVLIVTHAVTKL